MGSFYTAGNMMKSLKEITKVSTDLEHSGYTRFNWNCDRALKSRQEVSVKD